jgi:prevent-host-death family protein
MPIKLISDLKNKIREISQLVHRSKEPVFITKNGERHMVVMSMARYDHLRTKLKLYEKLAQRNVKLKLGRRVDP